MRVLVSISVAMVLTISLTAQTIIKPPPLSSWHIGSGSIDFNDTTVFAPRQVPNYLLGWQWAGPNLATNTRLKCNFYQDTYGIAIFQHYYSAIPRTGIRNYIVQRGLQIPGSCVDILYLHGVGLQFDPIAPTTINTSSPLIAHDTAAAIFGFSVRNLGKLSAYPSGDFNRFNLTTDSISGGSSSTGELVLDTPVILDAYSINPDGNTAKITLNGTQWILSANLGSSH